MSDSFKKKNKIKNKYKHINTISYLKGKKNKTKKYKIIKDPDQLVKEVILEACGDIIFDYKEDNDLENFYEKLNDRIDILYLGQKEQPTLNEIIHEINKILKMKIPIQ